MINAIVVLAYLIAMVLLGLYLAKFIRKDEDFFLAGRALNKWIIAGTVMATNVAAIYLVGPAGGAYSGGGAAVLLIAWTGNMIAAVSALVFVPRLRRLEITTVSELLETRYGLWIRLLPSAVWIVYYALFTGNAIYTLSTVLQPITVPLAEPNGYSVYTLVVIVGLGVIVYCAFSGLVAVAYTSVIQSFLIILGGIVLLPLTIKEVGGFAAFAEKTPDHYFVFWKTAADAPWPTYLDVIMFIFVGMPYWCTSQYMLQRSFAGRSVRDASKGLILAALLTGPLTLSYLVPGICAATIYSGENQLANTDSVLPQLLADVMPVGLGGLFIAALMAASNSTASALLNSLATLAEHDFYRRFIPGKSSAQYVWVGRVATLVGGAVGLFFAFNVENLGGIIQANFKIMGLFEPPIFVIVSAGLFWPWVNATGAGLAVLGGVTFGAVCVVYEIPLAERTISAFPVCIVLLIAGSAIGQWLWPSTNAQKVRVANLLAKTKQPSTAGPPAGGRSWLGVAIAILSLVSFVLCAFFEDSLPKPENILINLGLVTTFVLGCYLAVPLFVPEEPETSAVPKGDLERSWVHIAFGSGWAWLGLYVFAAVLMIALYWMT